MTVKFLLFFEALVYITAFVSIFRGGYKKHLPLLFVLAIMSVFYFLAPLYGYAYKIQSLFGNYLWNYYPYVLINYLFASIAILIGYLATRTSSREVKRPPDRERTVPVKVIRGGMLIGLMFFVLWGLSTGASLSSIFLLEYFGFAEVGSAVADSRGNPYLLLMIEIFIPILALALYSKMKGRELVFWLCVTAVVYLSQGFRYRLIMLVASLLIVYLYRSQIKFTVSKVLVFIVLISLTMYSIINISNYRSDIRSSVSGSYSERYSSGGQREFSEIVFASTRVYLPFAALVKHMDQRDIPYGYGETMFGHIFVRMIPSFFFEDGIKPEPPAVIVSQQSWGGSRYFGAGEAYGGVGGVYYEYGTIGVVIYFIILGAILGRLTLLLNESRNQIFSVMYIVTSVAFFILITRGYLPGFFFSYCFMMIPFIFLKYFFPKRWNARA